MKFVPLSSVRNWDIVKGYWCPISFNMICPNCSLNSNIENNPVNFSIPKLETEFDSFQKTLTSESKCPECRNKIYLWIINPSKDFDNKDCDGILFFPITFSENSYLKDYMISSSDVEKWGKHKGTDHKKQYPEDIRITCPHCNIPTIFRESILGEYDKKRNTVSSSANCLNCNKKVLFWTINPTEIDQPSKCKGILFFAEKQKIIKSSETKPIIPKENLVENDIIKPITEEVARKFNTPKEEAPKNNITSIKEEVNMKLESEHLNKIIKNKNGSTAAQVIFMDIEKYSKRNSSNQKKVIDKFIELIKNAIAEIKQINEFAEYATDNGIEFDTDIIKIPTGDGLAIVFTFIEDKTTTLPLQFAQKLLHLIKSNNKKFACVQFQRENWCNDHNHFKLRIGINEGNGIVYKDVNRNYNFAGTTINMASRIMDFADGMQILFSENAYQKLVDFDHTLTDNFKNSIEIEVKFGIKLKVRQYFSSDYEYINSESPQKINQHEKIICPINSRINLPKMDEWEIALQAKNILLIGHNLNYITKNFESFFRDFLFKKNGILRLLIINRENKELLKTMVLIG
ncbi:MAG: hypothetical protein HY774_25165 [Acidobacteria bacterium]|nr:hypothetical protein [Acidobacteriota bacterium]